MPIFSVSRQLLCVCVCGCVFLDFLSFFSRVNMHAERRACTQRVRLFIGAVGNVVWSVCTRGGGVWQLGGVWQVVYMAEAVVYGSYG
jgi:hypothetical protein